MITDQKFDKFLTRLEGLVSRLATHQDLSVHSRVDQFYYMQKIVELRQLKDRLGEGVTHLKYVQLNLESVYRQVFVRWSRDIRWLNRRQSSSEKFSEK